MKSTAQCVIQRNNETKRDEHKIVDVARVRAYIVISAFGKIVTVAVQRYKT